MGGVASAHEQVQCFGENGVGGDEGLVALGKEVPAGEVVAVAFVEEAKPESAIDDDHAESPCLAVKLSLSL